MKKTICLLTVTATFIGILFLPGCANLSNEMQTPVALTNGAVGLRITKGRVTTGFQSTTALDKLRIANGTWNADRQSVGVDNLSQAADASKFADTLGAVLLKGLMAYMTGGASTLLPSGGGGTVPVAVPSPGTTPPILVDPTTLGAATFKVTPNGDLYVCLPNGSCLLITSNNIAHTK